MTESRFLRIKEVIGDKKSLPRILGLIPMSRSQWYAGIKKGIYPRPVKHGAISFWKYNDIQLLIEKLSQ